MAKTGLLYVELLTNSPVFQHFFKKVSKKLAIYKEIVYIRLN